MNNSIFSSEKLGSMTSYVFVLAAFNNWFTATNVSRPHWGWASFMKLANINDPKNGFIVNDSCLLYVDISVQAVVRKSPLSTGKSG